jgi:hypothetical protein
LCAASVVLLIRHHRLFDESSNDVVLVMCLLLHDSKNALGCQNAYATFTNQPFSGAKTLPLFQISND